MQPKKKRLSGRTWYYAKHALIIGLCLFLVATASFALWAATLPLPDFNSVVQRKVAQSTKIYDRTGKILLYDVHSDAQRTVVPFDQISDYAKKATLAIEDPGFYSHSGIELKAIARSIVTDILTLSKAQGGSTITQQVVKKILLTDDKSITRKIKELILATKLDKSLPKDQIFSLYLNEIPYGGSLYGIEAASESFFNKKASEVTLAEAAYLAAIPNAPTYYSPYGANKAKLDDRKNLVLRRMKDAGFITPAQYTAALTEVVTFQPAHTGSIKAPHFVMWVKGMLEKKYGEDMVLNGGLKVTTTLDWDLESKAEELAAQYGLDNEKKFHAQNVAMTGIEPSTGQVLMMVGSRDYFDPKLDGNFNIALAKRQPGSSFKPIVYATAFEKGYTPDTTLWDVETEFDTNCTADSVPITPGHSCYSPEDYDHIFRGPISIRNALAQSVNIPAIEALYLVSIPDALTTAKALGITSLNDPSRYGLTLVLGGGEVSLLEMTSVYSVFANDGVRNPYTAILKVENLDGSILEEYTPQPNQVLPQNVARQINDVLADNNARAPAFGYTSALYIPERQVAVKTGTTNDYKDAWIIGYTPNLVVGAWAGNNDNTPMDKKVAGFIIAPLWSAYMHSILPKTPEATFTKPDVDPNYSSVKPIIRGVWQGNETYTIDKTSGKLATDLTPPNQREEKVVTNVHSILYWVDKKDPRGPVPVHPENDPQFNLWEPAVRKWAAAHGYIDQLSSVKPTETDNAHLPEYAPQISIVSPLNNSAVQGGSRATATVTVSSSHYPIAQADFFVNNIYIGSAKTAPYSIVFVPRDVQGIQNVNQLRAVVFDTEGNKSETTSTFSIVQ